MQRIGFYIALPFIYFVSILPFPLLYFVSDILYLLVYYVIGYRKNVVRQNLRKSFPDKSAEELKKIEKQFYHYIVDFFLEMLKCVTISNKELSKRVKLTDTEILDDLFAQHKSVLISSGHYGNHEIVNLSLTLQMQHRVKAVYKTLSNPFFEKFFLGFRQRNGTKMIPTAQAKEEIKKKDARPYAFFILNDQSPLPEKAYWTNFLNQPTGFYTGMETFAKEQNLPVLYMKIQRPKRGYYTMHIEKITTEPLKMADGEIIELHARLLEKCIIEYPPIWFWTHKRWKSTKIDGKFVNIQYKK